MLKKFLLEMYRRKKIQKFFIPIRSEGTLWVEHLFSEITRHMLRVSKQCRLRAADEAGKVLRQKGSTNSLGKLKAGGTKSFQVSRCS